MSRKTVTGSVLSYSSAILFCRVAAVVQGLFVIRWMEPGVLGMWLQLQLITIYGTLAHFGVLNAVNRQVPFHNGRDEPERARHVEAVARGLLMVFLVVGLIALAGMYVGGVTATARGRGILTLVFAAIVTLGIDFHLGLFRARHQFGRAGLASVVTASVILLGLPLVYYWNFDGLLWRAAAASTAGLVACLALNDWNVTVTFDRGTARELLRVGSPIMVVGLGTVAFTSMDRTLIALLLHEDAMGQYALCFALAKVLALFPMAIAPVYYPRMTELYSASGISRELIRRCVEASALSAAIVGVLAGGAFFTMPWLVGAYFPKYTGGLPALKIALLSYFILALAAGPTYFVISTVQKRRQLVALLLGLVATVSCGWALQTHALVGIAWALVAGSAVYVSGLWMIVLRSPTQPSRVAS
jgi:O-antigen/teichoic acid export membrane protein